MTTENKLLTPKIILAETLRLVHQEASFISNINKSYDKKFAKKGAKVGDTIEVRLPNQYTVRRGAKMEPQDTKETKKKIKISNQIGVDIEFTSKELTLDLDRFSERFLVPAAKALVSNIESSILSAVHPKITSWSLVRNNDPIFKKILEGNERLSAKLCPDDNHRHFWMNTHDSANLLDEVKGLFNPQEKMSSLHSSGHLGRIANNNFYTNTHLQTFSNDLVNDSNPGESGTLVLKKPIRRAPKDGEPIRELFLSWKYNREGTGHEKEDTIYKALESDKIKPGTGIEIKDLLMLHSQTKELLPYHWRGVVTECVSQDEETSKVTIDPPIYWEDEVTINSNVGTFDKNLSQITESELVNLALIKKTPLDMPPRLMIQAHRDAFVFGTADLVMPDGVDFKSRQNHEGISMRIIRKYDYKQDSFPCRIDILYGYEYLRDEMAHKYFCE
ncbi:MAG: P22 phage major capsid protein family protein [Candidatus Thiodiazotropha sp. 6PLUC7]|nr:hypothetical protein [Candidatus Thiodiazotropha lotti]